MKIYSNKQNLHFNYNPDNLIDQLSASQDSDWLVVPAAQYDYNLFDYGKLWGKEETAVNHKHLFEFWKSSNIKTVLVYNYHPQLLKIYPRNNIIMITEHGARTNHERMCKEIIIVKS